MSGEIYEKNYLDFYDPVKCTGDVGHKWCTFQWRIYNIELCPIVTVRSPLFTTRLLQNTYWYLKIKLSSPGNLRIIKVSLHRLESAEKVVSIVDVIYKVDFNHVVTVSDKNILVYNDVTPSTDKHYYNATFYKSKLDYIIVECKLRPNKMMIQDVPHGKFDGTSSANFRNLLQSGELHDTIIEVGNQQLKAHWFMIQDIFAFSVTQNIICKSSEQSCQSGNKVIKIDNLPASVVKEMLKYAYTGQAYLDLDALAYKDTIDSYNPKFFQRCFWDDNPFATTFFNYETDSFKWCLGNLGVKSDRSGVSQNDLFRLNPGKLVLRLDILETKEEKKGLTLTYKYCGNAMPRPIMVSCNYYLYNEDDGETFKLGETEVLLTSSVMEAKVKLCSFQEFKRGKSILSPKFDSLFGLKTDLRYCYGSSKTSIENIYEGPFDILQCKGCELLGATMERKLRYELYTDITVESENQHKIFANKAVLIARWAEAEKFKVKEKSKIKIEGYDAEGLKEFLRQIYAGTNYEFPTYRVNTL